MDVYVNKISEISAALKKQEAILMAGFTDFERSIVDSLSGLTVSGVSKTIALEFDEEEEVRFGNIYFNGECLVFLFRESPAFGYEVFDNNQIFPLNEIPISWAVKIAKKDVFDSLIYDISKKLRKIHAEADESTTVLAEYKNMNILALNEDVNELVAKSPLIMESWMQGRNTIVTDPEYSITQTSAFLESVCRKVISVNNELPKVKDMTNLVNSAFKVIDGYPADAVDDMAKLNGGVKSIFQGIGGLRTKFGIAHGKSEDFKPLPTDIVTLANHLAGAVAVYLLRQSGQREV